MKIFTTKNPRFPGIFCVQVHSVKNQIGCVSRKSFAGWRAENELKNQRIFTASLSRNTTSLIFDSYFLASTIVFSTFGGTTS